MDDNRITTPRRNLEQILHCAREALSAWEAGEDFRHVRDDLLHAQGLINHVLKNHAKREEL